jgi:hypothetical protein
MGAVRLASRTSVNPAVVSRCRTRPGSPSENGPGAAWAGVGSPRPASSARKKALIHSWRSNGCQVSSTSRPPGRRARAMLANAARGSPRNIDPWRLTATSNDPAGKGWVWASACANVALATPSRSASSRAGSSIRDDRSTPSAEPADALRAASRVARPLPQPTSSTVAVVPIAAASRKGRWWVVTPSS